jgi:hypothetical protein
MENKGYIIKVVSSIFLLKITWQYILNMAGNILGLKSISFQCCLQTPHLGVCKLWFRFFRGNITLLSNGAKRNSFECFLLPISHHETFHEQVWAHFEVLCKGYCMASVKKFHMLFIRCQMQNKSLQNYPLQQSNRGHVK